MGEMQYRREVSKSSLRSPYVGYFSVALALLSMFVILAFRVEADVAIFESNTYLEQGVEVTDASGTQKNIQYEHFWSDFSGTVPPQATVNNIALRFTWSVVTRSVLEESIEHTPSDVPGEETSSSTITDTRSEEAVVDEDMYEHEESDSLPEVPDTSTTPPDVEMPVVEDTQEEVLINIVETPSPIIPIIDSPSLPEATTEEATTDPSNEAQDTVSDTEGFEEVSWHQLYVLAQAQSDASLTPYTNLEDIALTTSAPLLVEDTGPEVLIAESISTTSGFVSSEMIIENLDQRFFEVRYSIDGATWYTLGTVGLDDAQDTVFDLTHIGLEAVSNLQVAIRYMIPEGEQTKIIFDSMLLEVGYGEVLPIEVVEPVRVNDNEPNFEISMVKSDVQSENIRAVVLERGGMLEFWYAVTEYGTGNVLWHRLVGGSAIDSEAPIGIKERTIFWVDRNEQTLFSFAVDTQSLVGVPFQNAEDRTFLLPFTNEDNEAWEATFDPALNSLEFRKVRNKSL